jgi:hypothetical protein
MLSILSGIRANERRKCAAKGPSGGGTAVRQSVQPGLPPKIAAYTAFALIFGHGLHAATARAGTAHQEYRAAPLPV